MSQIDHHAASPPGVAFYSALFLLGFATFALLYGPQPLLPAISADFGVSPAAASAMISTTTLVMACFLIPFGAVSDRWGRKNVMVFCLAIASGMSLLITLVETLNQALLLRALIGVALAGVPAVTMAYLADEIAPNGLAKVLALYAAGNAVGGFSGRLIATLLESAYSWKTAILLIAVLASAITLLLCRALPRERGFIASSLEPTTLITNLKQHLSNPALLCLFGLGFLIMGCFVSVYNYLAYWVMRPPLNLGALEAGSLFVFLLLGPPTSLLSARLMVRKGYARTMTVAWWLILSGLLCMLATPLPLLIAGLVIYTTGYFVAYATAGAWVAASTQQARGLATGLYLASFYTGGALIGTGSGLVWDLGAWQAVIGLLILCLVPMWVLIRRLSRPK